MTDSTQNRLAIVIPARYGSTRLPGKPLADILGKPMVQHVYERALLVPRVDAVLVATDDARVEEGGQVLIVDVAHARTKPGFPRQPADQGCIVPVAPGHGMVLENQDRFGGSVLGE